MKLPIADEVAGTVAAVRDALPEGLTPRFSKWADRYTSGKDRSAGAAMELLSAHEWGYLPDNFAHAREAAHELLMAAAGIFGRSEEVREHLRKAKKLIAGEPEA